MNKNNISKIDRIHLNLFDLKSKKSLIEIYELYKNELRQYFDKDGKPIDKYFEKKSCPICESDNFSVKAESDNFVYNQCSNCEAIYNRTMLKNEVLMEMYKSGIYLDYFKKLVVHGDKLRKEKLELRKVKQISSFFESPGRVLDVGCGSGSLLKVCQENGWDVHGIDPSDSAVQIAKEKYDLDIHHGYFENFESEEKFDCIVFIGLEHLQNPMGGLEKASKLLKKNGIIFFEGPSADCFLMEYMSQFPFHATRYFESARHYLFFSKRCVEVMCEKFNLELAHIESNGLDFQTIILEEFDDEITNKLLNMQEVLNSMLLGDHYRVFLRKTDI